MKYAIAVDASGIPKLEVEDPIIEEQKAFISQVNGLFADNAARLKADKAFQDQRPRLEAAAKAAFGDAPDSAVARSMVADVDSALKVPLAAPQSAVPAYLKMTDNGLTLDGVVAPTTATTGQQELARLINEQIGRIKQNVDAHPELANLLQQLQNAADLAFGTTPDEAAASAMVVQVQSTIDSVLQPKLPVPVSAASLARGIYVLTPGDRQTSRSLQVVMDRGLTTSVLPADQIALKAAVDDTLLTLKLIFPGTEGQEQNSRFVEYRQRLIEIADVGLAGAQVFPTEAHLSLDKLRAEVVAREAGRVKNSYMQKLGGWAVGSMIAATGLYVVMRWPMQDIEKVQAFRHFAVMWAGCMLGTWLSFGTRRVVLQFDDLGRLEPDMLYPWARLVFAGLLTMVLGLVFATNMVNIQIGDLNTADLSRHTISALIVGIFCGLSEQALPTAVSQRSAQFFSELEKRGGAPPEARMGAR
jgi:hypothetical protein